ncbi:hypothetical protein HU200_063073 [Digitaria exilis]|uniref:Uncharacterized protein n=1 Tax=Digitaria exilis TaxID=1010633 RepID=A0A835A6N5_9POAL|nr:hypothetical protein HU200_063073 [Digitaria exilis]
MEFGAGIGAFGASMMVAWYFLSPDARGPHNLRYIIPMLLSFACFTSGVCLMLLSMNILELPENVAADVQYMTSKCLSWLCGILPVVTLLSPLVLSGYKIYRYLGLTLLVVVTAPIALLRWYTGHKAEGGDLQEALKEHKEQLESAFKFISAISNSASGGLVALVVNYNVIGGSGRTKGAVLCIHFLHVYNCHMGHSLNGNPGKSTRDQKYKVSRIHHPSSVVSNYLYAFITGMCCFHRSFCYS